MAAVVHFLFSALCLALAGFGASQQVLQAAPLIEALVTLNCTTLVSYLKKTNLDAFLNKTNSATIFAPNDDAFKKFSVPVADDEELAEILKSHVVSGFYNSSYAIDVGQLPSLNNNYTVFVDEYNMTGKKIVTANGGVIVTPDQIALNGIIHIVGKVIYPMATDDTLNTLAKRAPVTHGFIQSTPTVAKLLNQGQPGFTLFAPSDAAWTRVPFSVIEKLTDEKDRVLLMSHLINPAPFGMALMTYGPYFASAITPEPGKVLTLPTTANVPLNFTVDAATGGLLVNGAKVILPDVPATDRNIIHIIDRVLLEGLP